MCNRCKEEEMWYEWFYFFGAVRVILSWFYSCKEPLKHFNIQKPASFSQQAKNVDNNVGKNVKNEVVIHEKFWRMLTVLQAMSLKTFFKMEEEKSE